jgi:hypothetical protein
MPRLTRGAGPVGMALTAVDVWRRLSPRQKALIAAQARKYGPAVAAGALRGARAAATSLKAARKPPG